MAWYHNGKKYWYHNGRRYSKKMKYGTYKLKRDRDTWLKFADESNSWFNIFHKRKNKWHKVNYDYDDYKLFEPNDIGGYKSKYDFIDNKTDELDFEKYAKIYGYETAKRMYTNNIYDFDENDF